MTERPILFSAPMIKAILDGRKTQTRRLINMSRLSAVVPKPISEDINGYHLGSTTAGRFRVGMNPQGAVFKLCNGDKTFGLKPGEFNFVCPYVDGRTWLTPKTPDRSAPWTITPDGSQRLWVREEWSHDAPDLTTCRAAHDDAIAGIGYGPYYRATETAPDTLKWRPGIFMPRWASRITLEVTEVRVQRLQAISCGDIRAEGIDCPMHDFPSGFCTSECGDLRSAFHDLWNSINGSRRRREAVPLGDPGYMVDRPWRTIIDTSARWETSPWIWAISFRRLP